MVNRLSSSYYEPLQNLRFIRIHNQFDNTTYITLYVSNRNKKDNYYRIIYNNIMNERSLLYNVDKPIILWTD
jgi:hypothetical protein